MIDQHYPDCPASIPEDISKLMVEHPGLRIFMEEMQAQISLLRAEVKSLRDQLHLDSHNSSQPPSSDKGRTMRNLRSPSGRKPGGQAGHQGETLKFSERVNRLTRHPLVVCSRCGGDLSAVPPALIHRRQVFDLAPLRLEITEHQVEVKSCPYCQAQTAALFPADVNNPTQYGPQVKGLVVYLNQYQLLPYQRISELFRDLFGQIISPATIYQANQTGYHRLQDKEQAIQQTVLKSAVANFDETGLYENGQGIWLHTASTSQATYYSAHSARGHEGMAAGGILPLFHGVAVHDHWKSYQRYQQCAHAFCNAHHLRELIQAEEQEGMVWATALKKLLLDIKAAVAEAKSQGQEQLDEFRCQSYTSQYRAILEQALSFYPPASACQSGKRGKPKQAKSKNLLDRLRLYETETLRFMHDFRVPFDNNLAERDLRMVKVKQKVSGCFRSEEGISFFCRIRGFISTTKKQGRNILESLTQIFQPQLTTSCPDG